MARLAVPNDQSEQLERQDAGVPIRGAQRETDDRHGRPLRLVHRAKREPQLSPVPKGFQIELATIVKPAQCDPRQFRHDHVVNVGNVLDWRVARGSALLQQHPEGSGTHPFAPRLIEQPLIVAPPVLHRVARRQLGAERRFRMSLEVLPAEPAVSPDRLRKGANHGGLEGSAELAPLRNSE